MIERALSFGPNGRLSGVLTTPKTSPRGPAVLLWNVGVNHHVGPYRIYVDLARRLASIGVASLRFDVSGLGDSDVRRDAVPELQRALDDLGFACDVVKARTGIERVVPVGFCSSVDAAHAFAAKDARAVGACFIEGYAFRTRGFWTRYPLRFLSAPRWRRTIALRGPRRLRELIVGAAEGPMWGEDQIYVREYPTPAELRRDYASMLGRGARLLFLYVGGDSSFNHEGQLREVIGDLADRVTLRFEPHADHTFFRVDHRRRAVEHVTLWIQRDVL